MTTQLTKEQLLRFIESVDDVLSAQAGTNEDVHPESDDMIRLWDYLNDVAAPPAPVVPDEMPVHTGPREFGRPQAYVDGWNAAVARFKEMNKCL